MHKTFGNLHKMLRLISIKGSLLDWSTLLLWVCLYNVERVEGLVHAGYKESCNERMECDPGQLLTCGQGQCECVLADSTLFDEVRGVCVSLSEEPCGSVLLESLPHPPLLGCVQGGFCNEQGYCQCSEGFYRVVEDKGLSVVGSCQPQKPYGDSCNSSFECLSSDGLECMDGSCKCNRSTSVDNLYFGGRFPQSSHTCLLRAGRSCRKGRNCVPNAQCRLVDVGSLSSEIVTISYQNEVEEGSTTEAYLNLSTLGENVCSCLAGYSASDKGLCLGGYGNPCQPRNNLFCLGDFSCVNGECGCRHGRDQVYDKDLNVCLSLVGGPCREADLSVNKVNRRRRNYRPEVKCTKNTKCVQDEDNPNFMRCACKDGLIENGRRGCDISYGHPCAWDPKGLLNEWEDWEDDEVPVTLECDLEGGLVCHEGSCLCPDPTQQLWDTRSSQCRSRVGSYCTANFTCVKGAECDPWRGGQIKGHGRCRCKDDYEYNPDSKTCKHFNQLREDEDDDQTYEDGNSQNDNK